MARPIDGNNRPRMAFLSLVVAIITLRDTECSVGPGLDPPFRWAFNYFLAHDRSAFTHLQYTVGPLCLLKWPVPMGDHIIISTIFYLLMGWLFTYLFTLFFTMYRESRQLIVPVLASMVFLLVVNVEAVLLGCVLLPMLFDKFLDRRGYIVISILLSIVGVYLKTSLFVVLVFAWVGYLIYLLMQWQLRAILFIILAAASLFVVTGIALLGSAAGFINFAQNNVLFALKYSDLLSLYPYNSWWALGICWGSIGAILFLFRWQPGGFVMWVAGLSLFATWKYAMGREDFFHSISFVYELILLFLLFLLVQKKNVQLGAALFLTAICAYDYNMQYVPDYRANYFWLPGVINFSERVVHSKEFKEKELQESKRQCAENVLPEEWRKTIGNSATDAFPWDLSIIMVNDLKYRSRPCLQSMRLTRENDASDAAELLSPQGPQYIIWHATNSGKTHIDGLDDQYIPNTCMATMMAIIAGYQLTPMANEKFSVWAKRKVQRNITVQQLNSVTTTWGTWIDVPVHDSNAVVTTKVDYGMKGMYGLRSFLYKGLPVFTEYETDSGKVFQYSFAKQCAQEGLLANPLWTDDQLHFTNIRRIRFLNNRQEYFNEDVKVTFERKAFSN